MGRAGKARRGVALVAAALAASTSELEAQGSAASRAPLPAIDSVTFTAGGRYEAGGFKRFWLGDGWRELWTTSIRVPVLDIHRFAGGLEFEEQGGGNQSITLHMVGADGAGYVFRSVDKHPAKTLPHDLKETPTGDAVQDLISALNPGAGLVVARLLDATPILHVTPRLAVMPDDPALGEFRDTFAGMLGTIEEKPNEGPDDTPGWAGSEKIVDIDRLMELMEESPEHRLDAREFLMARLFDIVVGDTDRAADQWRAARFDAPEGGYVYRPLPRDRDWAFSNGEGALLVPGRSIYPKLIAWGPRRPNVRASTIQAWGLDRPLLVELEWSDWEAAVRALQSSLTDEAIADAVRSLPPPWQGVNAERLVAGMRARRDAIGDFAREYYLLLAQEPEIHATDEDDRVEVVRHEGGDVEVRIADGEPARVWFHRRFKGEETAEVRLHLHGGDDFAVVSGPQPWDAPMVRIRGGGGDDVLIDTTEAQSGEARLAFYDDRGDNDIRARGATIVDTREWEEPPLPVGFAALSGRGPRDWGSTFGWRPTWEYGGVSGLVIGGGPTYTRYGYRRHPYAYRIGLNALYSFRHTALGAQLDADYRLPNSPLHFELYARGTQFNGFAYYGIGNDTPLETNDDLSIVASDWVRVRTLAALDIGDDGRIAAGPVLGWTEPNLPEGSRIESEAAGLRGANGFGQIGARVEGSIDRNPGAEPRSGWAVAVALEGYPEAWDADDFATAQAVLRGYLDLPVGAHHPKLALRLGGRRAWGGWPVFEGAFIGGMETVRGLRYWRLLAEQAAWGNAELRAPLFEMTLVSRGRLGVLGLADAGRVWQDGDSPGGWHTAYGGGVFYETLGRAVSVLYARGEEDRWYLQIGMPF
ncbi:MAG TPA: hypothetical protein VMN78_13960 [Longimicrobiales bacterium]|nr:hypothetical protein [Longimicrobiales bacterium]